MTIKNKRRTARYGAGSALGDAGATLGGFAGANLSTDTLGMGARGAWLASGPLAEGAGAALLDAAGAGSALSTHTMRPKRDARWKLPWPKIGDHDTPPLFFMA